ncbi:MAG TPA: preprotein translocase subunit YajC [Candidatus Tectomicrobia bacterium]|nr:preprotein translocase subunit YajC [Candidatus Tectomicrobia bacterium]
MNVAFATDLAHAAAAPPGDAGGAASFLNLIVPFVLMFAIFYFIVIRPQQKQRQERDRMLAALKAGDKVVTTSGLHGTIIRLSEHTVTLRVGEQVRLEFDRAAIARVTESQSEKDA